MVEDEQVVIVGGRAFPSEVGCERRLITPKTIGFLGNYGKGMGDVGWWCM